MYALTAPMLLAAGDEAVAVVAVSGGVLIAITYTIAHAIRRHTQSAYNARLKQMMIDRGMSADEIVRVIGAGDGGRVRSKGDWA